MIFRFTIRDVLWMTVVVAAFCTGTQLDRYLEHYRADPREASIRAALNQTTHFDLVETPLKDVVFYFADKHDIPILIRSQKLEEASISQDTPVTKSVRSITLRSALKLLLNDLDLVENGVLTITTKEEAQSNAYPARRCAMADTPDTCDGCSACCYVVGHPPFLLELDNGIPRPIEGLDSHADYQRLLAAPSEAQAAYLTNHGAINSPCTWLDEDVDRCRYYEFRPDVCRTFEIGGVWCSQLRVLHEIH